ncbi:efflux RND transporter permease subunit [Klebsiella pneumoniae subsp. pneumoniae]|nr:efflux RND transporter permease subunit [Klebsiella pneumoniae subsp. pneumoniae]
MIGLSAKNAILIVEFANELNEKGQDLLSATLSACRQRLRPILMTSLAFIFGACCRWRPAPAPVPAASMRSAPE